MLTKFFVLAGSVPVDPSEGMTMYGPYDTYDDAMAFVKDTAEPGEQMIIFSAMAESVTAPDEDEPEVDNELPDSEAEVDNELPEGEEEAEEAPEHPVEESEEAPEHN